MTDTQTTQDSGTALNGVATLTHLGVLCVQGQDAASFLHSQLTQDFVPPDPQRARLAAYLSAKGRMLASCIAVQRGADQILLVCSRDLLEATRARLARFVLRAKVTVRDASADYLLCGLVGAALTRALAGAAPPPPWGRSDSGAATLVQLYPADGQPRALWIAPAGSSAPPGAQLATPLWLWSEVRSGVVTLSAALADAFVPQMLNYESVGAVNFKKGCYPGQEVVARSQFRGALKRRAYLAHAAGATALDPGAELFAAPDLDQPCGSVVQAARAPGGGVDAIVVLQSACAQAALQVGTGAQATPLELLALPYELLQDI